MKWVVVAIVVFVAGYTVVNLLFRKPGRAYRPYQDAQDRATRLVVTLEQRDDRWTVVRFRAAD